MNNSPDNLKETRENKLWIRNYFLSILFHVMMLIIFLIIYNLNGDRAKINSIMFSLDTKEYLSEKFLDEDKDIDVEDNQLSEQIDKKIEETQTVSFSDMAADTTNLDQIYSETTLNVKIKYPKGWTFIDQNRNKKLDGVTFWANDQKNGPPPYIHLEVVDKEMFIERKYSYKIDTSNFVIYYNDPEEMQGYVTQIFYIRTGEDEDFKLKLTVKGENQFNEFKPRFWAILKSFNFGRSIF